MTRPKRLDLWEPSEAQRQCLRDIAKAFGLPATSMVSRSRKGEITRARQAGYWVVRKRWPKLSWPMVGKLFGGRDHSTVIYGARQCEKERRKCADYRARTDALAAALPVAPPQLSYSKSRELAWAIERENARREAEARRLLLRKIRAEVQALPEPQPHRLGIQLKRQDGCPGLDIEEIEARREQVRRERRARELALLEDERRKYALPRRGLALSEMAL